MASITRRALLRSGLLAGVAALAGCRGSETPSAVTTPTPTPTTTPLPSVFEDIGTEGNALVVRLVDDHTVSRLNLIAPDGTLFGSATIPTGATTARIEILDIEWGLASYDHYEPGQYTLVTVPESDADPVSVPVDLVPELRILDISQYRDGEWTADLAQIVVRIENVGTGPTWVSDFTYQDAPNWTVNNDYLRGPGLPSFAEPSNLDDILLPPGGQQTYVEGIGPLLFTSNDWDSCDIERDMTVIVGTAVGEPLEQTVRIKAGGEQTSVGLVNDFVCSRVAISPQPENAETGL
ncbi:hypothetical protein [Haloarcula halophila]|uniref:hypothetical protein n=1 Tax=Haloarcula TaxID=2237 RepID=UPI0023E3F30B|nr:hypothetical protein [Halomicroarcula sp. DFY41]